jgi:Fe-S-cluster containining protein
MTQLPLAPQGSDEPWYREGLRFQCTECGKCCTGAPGAVWVKEEDKKNLCQLLEVDALTLEKQYLRRLDGRWALQELLPKYDCVFLEGKRCRIYQARPLQCRTFPFWPGAVASKQSWQHAATYCEGIHDQAPIVPYEKIQQTLALHLKANLD